MQERRDGEVFVAAILENRRSHSQKMGHVRGVGSFANLSPVNVGRIEQSPIKPIS